MKYSLQSTYKSLGKKQKGLVIQEIISNPLFNKSKEWLRKYLTGAYNKIDEKVEVFGLEAVKKIGVSPLPFLPFRLNIESINDVEKKSNSPPRLPSSRSKDLFQRIYDHNFDSLSISKVGQAWLRFGRVCRKDLHKINPFRMITELVVKAGTVKNIEVIEELKKLYHQHINSNKEYIYMAAWELFSQKARFVYCLNPFIAIQAIITQNTL
jgi:hypothetical protein